MLVICILNLIKTPVGLKGSVCILFEYNLHENFNQVKCYNNKNNRQRVRNNFQKMCCMIFENYQG
jgi:hypothetical protein